MVRTPPSCAFPLAAASPTCAPRVPHVSTAALCADPTSCCRPACSPPAFTIADRLLASVQCAGSQGPTRPARCPVPGPEPVPLHSAQGADACSALTDFPPFLDAGSRHFVCSVRCWVCDLMTRQVRCVSPQFAYQFLPQSRERAGLQRLLVPGAQWPFLPS